MQFLRYAYVLVFWARLRHRAWLRQYIRLDAFWRRASSHELRHRAMQQLDVLYIRTPRHFHLGDAPHEPDEEDGEPGFRF